MFGAYRIGANTPSDVRLPLSPETHAVYESGSKLYGLAAGSVDAVRDATKASNFLAQQPGGNAFSYYKAGVVEVGAPWIATPSFLKDEMLRVQGEAQALGRDIETARTRACELPGGERNLSVDDTDCGKLNRFLANSWSPFLIELNTFVARHSGGFWNRFWGNLYDEVQEYRKRLIALRKVAVGLIPAGGVTSPEPTLPPPPAISQIGDTLRTILYFIVGGLLLWFVFMVAVPALRGGTAVV